MLPATCGTRGVIVVTTIERHPERSPDGIALVERLGQVVEFLSYEGVFAATSGPAAGMTSSDIGASQSNARRSACRCSATRRVSGRRRLELRHVQRGRAEPGRQYASASRGRDPSRSGAARRLRSSRCSRGCARQQRDDSDHVTWSSETPAIASIDQNGVMHALAAGSAIVPRHDRRRHDARHFRSRRASVCELPAQYGGNAEFGEPVDGNAATTSSFDTRYTSSYNQTLGRRTG